MRGEGTSLEVLAASGGSVFTHLVGISSSALPANSNAFSASPLSMRAPTAMVQNQRSASGSRRGCMVRLGSAVPGVVEGARRDSTGRFARRTVALACISP